MLTDQDIKKLTDVQRKVFATKDDLKAFATKDDINEVKDDITEVKSDLVKLESRMITRIGESEDRLTNKFSDLQSSVDRCLKITMVRHQELKGVVTEQEVALLA